MDNQKEINGRVYSFGMLPPSKSIPVQVAITRVIGEPLFKMFTERKTTGDEDMKTAATAAMGLIAANMDSDELLKTMRAVFDFTSIDGKRIADIDSAFSGRNKEMWQAFIAALRFNFSDFFPAGLLNSSLVSV